MHLQQSIHSHHQFSAAYQKYQWVAGILLCNNFWCNKATADHTSHVLCTPITPAATEWSVLLLNGGIFSERVTMHCQWEGKPQNCPFPLGFCHPVGSGPSHSHRQHAQKFGKDRACRSTDIMLDRHTDAQTHRQTGVTDHNTSPQLPQAK